MENEVCTEDWYTWNAMRAAIVFGNNQVSAHIKCNDDYKASVINVDVNGKCHNVPLTSNIEDEMVYKDDIYSLFIRFFSPTSFVVFAQIDNGPWPFACFLQSPDGAFQCKVCYSVEAVCDIAVIDDRFLVIDEVIVCHRHLWVKCYDMQTAELVWSVATENLDDYFLHMTYLETDERTNNVKIHLNYFPTETSRLVLTANEHGIIDAASKSYVTPKWSWKLPGDDQPFRTQPVVVAKAVVA